MQQNTSLPPAGVFRGPAQATLLGSACILSMVLPRHGSDKPSAPGRQLMPGGAGAGRFPAEPIPAIIQLPKAAALSNWLQYFVRRLENRLEYGLKLVCDATGITVAFCRARHQRHQVLYPVEFGGGYVRQCELCGCASYVQR